MAFATTDEHIRRAEAALGRSLPSAHRSRLLRENGGDVEAAGDTWQLFPVFDTTDRKHLSRTANHILRETDAARAWPSFPPQAVAIAANGTGNYLILIPTGADAATLLDTVFVWDHETGAVTPIDVSWGPDV